MKWTILFLLIGNHIEWHIIKTSWAEMLDFCLQVLGSAPLTATSSSVAAGHRWAGAKSYPQESEQILRWHLLPSYIPRLFPQLGASGSSPLSFLVFYRLEPLFRWSLGLILTLPWILPFRSHPTVLCLNSDPTLPLSSHVPWCLTCLRGKAWPCKLTLRR